MVYSTSFYAANYAGMNKTRQLFYGNVSRYIGP